MKIGKKKFKFLQCNKLYKKSVISTKQNQIKTQKKNKRNKINNCDSSFVTEFSKHVLYLKYNYYQGNPVLKSHESGVPIFFFIEILK
jgi:hypothetical protein